MIARMDDEEGQGLGIFPATVVIDTREQAPFRFLSIDPWRVVPVETRALATGDYSLAGHEHEVTVERKSVGDFLGSITAGRERFEREFARMAEMSFAAVVVEGELSEVMAKRGGMSPESILGTIDSWSITYGVHWRFCPGRRFAEIATLRLLAMWLRKRSDKAAKTQA